MVLQEGILRPCLTLANTIFWLLNPNPKPDPHLNMCPSLSPPGRSLHCWWFCPWHLLVAKPTPTHGSGSKGTHLLGLRKEQTTRGPCRVPKYLVRNPELTIIFRGHERSFRSGSRPQTSAWNTLSAVHCIQTLCLFRILTVSLNSVLQGDHCTGDHGSAPETSWDPTLTLATAFSYGGPIPRSENRTDLDPISGTGLFTMEFGKSPCHLQSRDGAAQGGNPEVQPKLSLHHRLGLEPKDLSLTHTLTCTLLQPLGETTAWLGVHPRVPPGT